MIVSHSTHAYSITIGIYMQINPYTVYGKSLEEENFCAFCGFTANRECFIPQLF